MPRAPAHDVHIGVREVADLLGVRRQTTAQWQFRGLLPESCCTVSGYPAWQVTVIEQWARQHKRWPHGDRTATAVLADQESRSA